jgi:competence protein ComEA
MSMDGGTRIKSAWRLGMLAGAVLALLGAGFILWRLSTTPTSAETVASDALSAKGPGARHPAAAPLAGAGRMVVVYISGAVANPGMYHLASGLRIGDALAAAGGMLGDADPDRLPNLAGRLSDGKQIKVPRLKAGSSQSATNPKVDINSADAAQLQVVPGIDAALAQAIVDYRQSYGPFASVTELRTALGLDTATLSAIRKYLIAG